MVQQARAIQTRKSILLAAAAVFDERGYNSATITEILARANVTKGALYFHFTSKEELAQGVMEARDAMVQLPPQPTKLQELIDQGLVLAHQLSHDALTRAAFGLASEEIGRSLGGSTLRSCASRLDDLLRGARKQGVLLPHVNTSETAELLVGSLFGVYAMSHVLKARTDLTQRFVVLLQHVLPSIAVPAVLPTLDLSADRALRLVAEVQQAEAAHDGGPKTVERDAHESPEQDAAAGAAPAEAGDGEALGHPVLPVQTVAPTGGEGSVPGVVRGGARLRVEAHASGTRSAKGRRHDVRS